MSIIKLVHIKNPSELAKSKKFPIGTTRQWKGGTYKKEAERKWKPLPAKGTPDWHKLKIAKDTMKMNPVMASVMGGPSVDEAKATLAEYGLVEAPGVKYGEMKPKQVKEVKQQAYDIAEESFDNEVLRGSGGNINADKKIMDAIAAREQQYGEEARGIMLQAYARRANKLNMLAYQALGDSFREERLKRKAGQVEAPAGRYGVASMLPVAYALGQRAFRLGITERLNDKEYMALLDRAHTSSGSDYSVEGTSIISKLEGAYKRGYELEATIKQNDALNTRLKGKGRVESPTGKYSEKRIKGLFPMEEAFLRSAYRTLSFDIYGGKNPSDLNIVRGLEKKGMVQLFEETDSRARERGISHIMRVTDKGREALGLPEREPYPMVEAPKGEYGEETEKKSVPGEKIDVTVGEPKMHPMESVIRQGMALWREMFPDEKVSDSDLARHIAPRIQVVRRGATWIFTSQIGDKKAEVMMPAEAGERRVKNLPEGFYKKLYDAMKSLPAHKLVFGKSAPASTYKHPDKLGAGAKKRKKLKKKGDKVEAVMHEYKRGTLHSGSGQKVTDKKQALAIALSEAGLSRKKK